MNVISYMRAFAIALVLSFALPAIAEVHGVLRVVKGDVKIKSARTGQTAKAKLGQEVYPKDTILTGKEARAKIVMIDNNEINVSPDSNVEIQNYEYNPAENKKDVLLNVIYGKVRSKVEQKYDGKTSKFQVKTPSAVAGVRGTDFMAGYNPTTKASQVVTFSGAVEFGTPGPGGTIKNSVSVTPGKMASSTGGAAPLAPAPVPKAELAKMDNETKAESSSGSDSRQPAQDGKGEKDKDKGDKDKGDTKSGKGDAKTDAKADGTGDGSKSGKSDGSSGSDKPVAKVDGPTSDAKPDVKTNRAPASDGFQSSSSGVGNATGPGPDHPPLPSMAVDGPGVPFVPPPPPPPPPVFVVPQVPTCFTCNQIISGGSAKLNVIVHTN